MDLRRQAAWTSLGLLVATGQGRALLAGVLPRYLRHLEPEELDEAVSAMKAGEVARQVLVFNYGETVVSAIVVS